MDWKEVSEMLYQIAYNNKEKVYFINNTYKYFVYRFGSNAIAIPLVITRIFARV